MPLFKRILLPLLVLSWLLTKIGSIPISLLRFFFKSTSAWSIYEARRLKSHLPSNPDEKKLVSHPLGMFLTFFLILVMMFFYSYFLIKLASDLPSPERLSEIKRPQTTYIYDRNGILLYKFYEGQNRTLVKLDELPPDLINATIAIEDKHFYSHPGIDIFAVLRALVANLRQKDLQGGSTITQQLIKNTLLTPERTLQRKIKELFLAYWTEKLYTKQEILQMYFNEAPYGGTAWGIEAGAQTYFNKKASDLNLAESSFLAGLPASPTEYSPFGLHPEKAKGRQKEVLNKMVEEGYINRRQANEAFNQPLNFTLLSNQILAPHFVMYIHSLLVQEFGEKAVLQGGLKVTTTLDLTTQKMAEKIVSEEVEKLKPLKVSNGAAMITDGKTGEILAMVGSKNYFDADNGNYNVTLALRQPGSSIKPITYATSFLQGYSPGTILLDTPTTFKNAWETYTPVNYDGKFHGAVSIRQALGSSFNIPAVKMLAIVGIPNMINVASDLGITTFNDPSRFGLSLTLGGGEIKMIDMMTAYGTFSQAGIKHQTYGILKVSDSQGNILEDKSFVEGEKVLPAGVAYLISNILADNQARMAAFGPYSGLNIPGKAVAVKTGTSDNKRDNWTFGYTPDYVVGVWVGNNDNTPMDPILTSGITGATPIWNKLMSNLLTDKPNITFSKPADVVEAMIDGNKDLVWRSISIKEVVSLSKKKVKDGDSNKEKEIITFSDPFTTYVPGEIKNP